MLRHTVLALALAAAACGAAAAPDVRLVDTQGVPHSPAQYQGKWVLVNIWATWCAPCVAEMPELEAVHRAHDDVVVLGLAVDGQNAQRVTQFAERLHASYPIIAGNDELARAFKPRGYPTSILYDRDGRTVLVKEGRITRAEVEHALAGRD